MEKKKLFISCPMKGRTEENIKKSMEKMHKLAEIVFDQELEVIDSYINENAPMNTNPGVWYLGKSIQLIAEADYFIGVDRCRRFWPGCGIELDIAHEYDIPRAIFDADQIMSEEEYKIVMTALDSGRGYPRRRY